MTPEEEMLLAKIKLLRKDGYSIGHRIDIDALENVVFPDKQMSKEELHQFYIDNKIIEPTPPQTNIHP